MRTVYKREVAAYFRTPTGYVFIGIFLALSGLLFYLGNLRVLSGDLLTFLAQLRLLCMLLCPLLTMRLISEERQKKSDQLVMTAPISLGAIVMGKYLAAASVMLLTILLLNGITLLIGVYGTLFLGEWFVGYFGFVLQSLAFVALDLFMSSFAKNQIIGAILGFAANFFLWLVDLLAGQVSIAWIRDSLNFISLYQRYEAFQLGQFSFASTLFFLTFIAVCLVGTVRVLDARRFSEGGAA